jgi:hypothetical protein
MSRGKQDPWIAGEPIEGVAFPYNACVHVLVGPAAGQQGWLVAVTDLGVDPLYTVELMTGDEDVEVRQSSLRLAPLPPAAGG